MKKISTSISSCRKNPSGVAGLQSAARLCLGVFSLLYLCSCAFTEYGNRINKEQSVIAGLEDKRKNLETHYIIILNDLETHPTDKRLIRERDQVRDKLRDVTYDIGEKRKMFEQSLLEWEDKVLQERMEQEMIHRAVRENQDKDEDVEFENK